MNAEHTPPIAGGAPQAARALVLAGGGMRVAYQAGVVKALFDEGIRFTFADGSSGGTINLAALMSGIAPDDLCARWRDLSVKKFASLRPASEYLHAARMPALGDADGMVQYVYPKLGVDIGNINAAIGIEAAFNVCRFDDKTVVPIPHTQLDMQRLVAAASLPIFMPAVQADGSTWTDAVWIKDANLLSCVERGARELWVVWCIGNTRVFQDGVFNQYVHMIEMSAVGALNWELATIAAMNARIASGETVQGHSEPIVVYVIRPELPLPLDPDFYLGRIDAATLIDMGYRDARRVLLSRQPAPLDSRATATQEPGIGVTFREKMSGGFALGVSDPQAAAAAGTTLTMNASIHINDIAAFVADPQHKADLTGHIDFEPFGMSIPAESGVFGLFTPSGDPALTYMVYELGFRHAGKSYYLEGKKHVRLGGPWRLWTETTTLFCLLHEGVNTAGRVVGAGTLRLGMADLFRLLGTFHATNAPTEGRSIKASWRFFRFFTAELMRTYILRRPH
ncbi:patatin-like phospholipase family protein [Paralcaligenes ginsengisoli]